MTIPQLSRRAFLIALFLPAIAFAQEKKRLVFLGDSITAGYGLEQTEAYPALIEQKIKAEKLPFEVVNAGVSGDTTAGGLRRLDWLLQQPIAVLVIALGGNDGLRGIAPEVTAANLQAMIDKVKARDPQTKIVIAGMRMPPNLGGDYAMKFAQVYGEIANKNGTAQVPFLLEGVGGDHDLNQADQIHPTAAGQKIIADTVWQKLQPLLH